jgi:hypothetical protein
LRKKQEKQLVETETKTQIGDVIMSLLGEAIVFSKKEGDIYE